MNIAKYSANGNDFVLFHSFIKKDRSMLARTLCDRQNGVGADGLIVLVPHETHDFEWEFYNADGSVADMCGNGSRACAHYALSNGLAQTSMSFLTGAGVIKAQVDEMMVQSDLTPPEVLDKEIEFNGKNYWLLNTGVPHLVTFDADIENFDILEARELRHKYNTNVNSAKVLEDGSIRVRTYERGVEDETLACGTGMAACFYKAFLQDKCRDSIEVHPQSGDTLYLATKNSNITFKGEVKAVFNTYVENIF